MYRTVILLLLAHAIFGQAKQTDYVPNQVIIKFKADRSEKQLKTLTSQMNVHLEKKTPLNHTELWTVTKNQDVMAFIQQYENHPDIEFIEPNYYYDLYDGTPEILNQKEYENTSITARKKNISLWEKCKTYFKKKFYQYDKAKTNNIRYTINETTSDNIIPNDFYFSSQWGLNNTGQEIENNTGGTIDADIDAPEVWETITTSPSIVIGVIDSGVDWTHPDLVNNIWQNLEEDADGDGTVIEWNGEQWIFDPGDENGIDDDGNGYADDFIGWNFVNNNNNPMDNQGHGTHVAGTIGAEGNNNIGIAGVTWDVQIAALKIFGEENTTVSSIAEAIDYAVMMDMPLSNNSYGGGWYSSAIRQSIENAKAKGHLFIAAAGNSFKDNDVLPDYPSSYPLDNIISVAASTNDDLLWTNPTNNNQGSSYGETSVDLSAPGRSILSTGPDGSYYSNSGTSMAASYVTGACALMWERNQQESYQTIKNAILGTVDFLPELVGKSVSQGRLNIYKALNVLEPMPLQTEECSTRDSLALIALFNNTNGPNWQNENWNLNEPMSLWPGVTLNEFGCVTEINLESFGLLGIIPPEIGNLSNLRKLNLRDNFLVNDVPASLRNLTNLKSLNLSANNLSGDLESLIVNLSYLPNLKMLQLHENLLTGIIPPEIGNLQALTTLNLRSLLINGQIPSQLGNVAELEILNVRDNALSGPIPSSLGHLLMLRTLDLSSNNLTGTIPSEIGDLTRLIRLYVSNNSLSGCYDPNLLKLIYLHSRCGEFCFIEDFISISTGNNFEVPWEAFIDSGHGSCVPIVFPDCALTDSLALMSFYHANNGADWYYPWDLDQPIRTWQGVDVNQYGCVTGIWTSGEYLIHTLHPDILAIPNLKSLEISSCSLSGNIAPEIMNVTDLIVLDLSNNNLEGSIPSQISNLTNLRELSLAGNSLINTIPSEIGFLQNLEHLHLSNNSFIGSIPQELGGLQQLERLYLFNNNLQGEIPEELGNLYNLEWLQLQNNNLEGRIPAKIGNLPKLSNFKVTNNNLNGCFDRDLLKLCDVNLCDSDISDGNNFSIGWTEFCNGDDTTICSSLVWPGDYNYDGTVDQYDLLYVNLALGNTGQNRPNATTDWQGQPAQDWSSVIEGVNGKHQDGNGDGVVDINDCQIVEDNFGSIHEFTYPVYEPDPLIFDFGEIIISGGDPSILVYVRYGDDDPIVGHGIAGVIEFGDWQINDATLDISVSSLQPEEVFQMFDPINNRLQFALNRIDKTDKPINGPILKISIDLGEDTYRYPPDDYKIQIQNGLLMQATGNTIGVLGTTTYPLVIDNDGGGICDVCPIVVSATIRHEQCTSLGSIKINSNLGYTYEWNTGSTSNELNDLTANIYKVTISDIYDGLTKTYSMEVERQYVMQPDENGNLPDCITPECPYLVTPDGTIEAGLYKASAAINSTGTIDGNVQYEAGETILLSEGFEVLQNKEFIAEIEECGN